jgi:argininosuccinate lyase
MINKPLFKILYSNDKKFIINYFKFLSQINLNYSEELKDKKILSNDEFLKIKKFTNFLIKTNYKSIIKKSYSRGYYIQFEKSFVRNLGIDIAGKMHIGRSRNELDSCISRMMMRSNIKNFVINTTDIASLIVSRFSENKNYFPYYTQNQPASFIKVNHYFNNILLSIYNYLDKFLITQSSIYCSPLGACGLNGSDFNLNYRKISKKLGFKEMEINSIKSVSDYEYLIYYVNIANIVVIKLSRMLHDFMFFQSYEINIIKINKKYSGKSSYFPHKGNPYLIEKCLSLSNELINYNNLLSNGLRKTINSNTFEIKNLIYETKLFFDKYNNFSVIAQEILKNIQFNDDLINNKKYNFLLLSSIQNQIIKNYKKTDLRSINNNLNKIYNENINWKNVIKYVVKHFPRITKNMDVKKLENNLHKFYKFGYGSNDKKGKLEKKYHLKIIKLFLKKI